MWDILWDIGGDEWDLFDVVGILEVVSLSLDEPELEAALFNDIGKETKLLFSHDFIIY